MNNNQHTSPCAAPDGRAVADGNPRRLVMQERYCSCGMSVLVEYKLNTQRPWETRFLLSGPQRRSIAACPCCGRRLNINTLR